MAEPILTVEHLVKGYGENTVLDDISFSVRPGEVVVVVGPSGCGKSTLLRCINALEPTQSGRVRLGNETVAYGGKGLTSLRQRIGMVFQSYELFPHLTVLDNVMLAPLKVAKRPKDEVQKEAEALLDRVNLLNKARSYPRVCPRDCGSCHLPGRRQNHRGKHAGGVLRPPQDRARAEVPAHLHL